MLNKPPNKSNKNQLAQSQSAGVGNFSVLNLLSTNQELTVSNNHPGYLVELIRTGIQSVAFDRVAAHLNIPKKEMAQVLNINERTLARRKDCLLTSEESEKLVRMSRIIDRASEVFGGKDQGIQWLKLPNDSLGGHSPMSYLDTDVGAEIVLDTLGRIEHGVFA